jgi:hypothetical protein
MLPTQVPRLICGMGLRFCAQALRLEEQVAIVSLLYQGTEFGAALRSTPRHLRFLEG